MSATRSCLEKAGWSLAQLDLIEANEAFAAQALAVGQELGWDADKVNVNGGAIALATLCIGGGQGVALAIER